MTCTVLCCVEHTPCIAAKAHIDRKLHCSSLLVRFASQLASGRATPDGFLQAMYAKWKPLGKDKEPPLPHEGGQPGDQSSDSDSEEDQPADDYVPPEYFVAPLHLRPWVPFSDNSLWPQVSTEQLRVGALPGSA